MARPHSHKRAARLAAVSILSLLGTIALVWAAPRVSSAIEAWVSTPPVELRTAELQALPVAAPEAGVVRGASAVSAAVDPAAPAPSAPPPAVTLSRSRGS